MNIQRIFTSRLSLQMAIKRINRAKSSGFTLLEVLVALLVFSIGFLGLAALQTLGMRFTHQSYERTQATLQAYEIMDRMRANIAGLDDYTPTPAGSTPNATVNCGTATCEPSEMAVYDLAQWLARIRDPNLLGGEGAVCRGTLNANLACTEDGSIMRVGVRWNEQGSTMQIIFEAGI